MPSPTVVATKNGASPTPSSAAVLENGKSTSTAIEKETDGLMNGEGEQTEQDQEYVEAVKRLEKVKVPARDDEHWRKILEEDDEVGVVFVVGIRYTMMQNG